MVAECMANSMSVRLARTRKIRSIIKESYLIQVIKAKNGEVYWPQHILTLVKEILEGKKNFDRIVFRYCNGKKNKAAKVLHKSVDDHHWTEKYPPRVAKLALMDCNTL